MNDFVETGMRTDSGSAASTGFNYLEHIGVKYNTGEISSYYPISPSSLGNIVNPIQLWRGYIAGATKGMEQFLGKPEEIREITFGPRLISNSDNKKIADNSLTDGELGKIYLRNPSLQIFSVVMPKNGIKVENTLETYEYAAFGKIEIESKEHKKRTLLLEETAAWKADEFMRRYSKEILNASPKWETKYTSDIDLKDAVNKTILMLGGNPQNSQERAYVHYTKYMNMCEESGGKACACKYKILGENLGHIIEIDTWDNLPPWIKKHRIENAIGTIPTPSIDGNIEMDKGVPFFLGSNKIIESQIEKINGLWKDYLSGKKILSYPLEEAFGNLALKEEKGRVIGISGGNLAGFTAAVAAYMLQEKHNYLLEELQEISNNAKMKTSKEEIRGIRKQKKELLHEMWLYSSENIQNLAGDLPI